MLKQIDYHLRVIFSIIYRFLIFFYSLTIVLTSKDNSFGTVEYLGVSLFFIVSFFLLRKSKFNKPFLRLLLDYCFIYFILFGRPISEFANYFLLILPIINASNNSSENIDNVVFCKRYYVYPFCVIGIIALNKFTFDLKLLIPVIVLVCIDQFLKLRQTIENVHSTIFKIIDEFYTKNYGQKELTIIYEELIQTINTTAYIRNLKVKAISCFIIKADKLLLVNSSNYIIEYSFEDLPSLIKEINTQPLVTGRSVVINKEEYNNSIFTLIACDEKKYVFLILTEKSISLFSKRILSRVILFPVLRHLGRLFETQFRLNKSKIDVLQGLKNKSDYVLKATEVMHYVKGSLSPIKSALTTSKLYDATDVKDVKMRDYLLEQFVSQRDHALSEIKNITDRAKLILENSKNPYIIQVFKDYTLYELFVITQRKWIDNFPHSKITVKNEVLDIKSLTEKMCSYNSDYLLIIYTDVISNIEKYATENKELLFTFERDFVLITFRNEVNNRVELKKLIKTIEDFNSNEKWEIHKRNSHGWTHIRMYCHQMRIGYFARYENSMYELELKIMIKK
ncbi:MAG TPA: hypothetical protein VK835_14985 [Bacteroidia bacterium]|jgi:hypothetical protein|nr:hypothetical protein [Bacteroidia bacterium]